jgi:outer membrane protein assembly factor BamB/subtilisin family serine protease
MTPIPLPKASAQHWTRLPCHRGRLRYLFALAAAAALACASSAAPFKNAAGLSAKELAQGYRDGVVLAKPKAQMLPTIDKAEQAEGLVPRADFERFGHVRVLGLAAGDTVPAAIARLRSTGRYEYVEPDYIRRTATVPNDLGFGSQWGLNNTGLNAGGGGIPGADIHAEAGWQTRTGAAGVIVGMLDSGALLSHQDLVANLWVNPNPGVTASYNSTTETDSLNGLNAVAKTGPPADDVDHGTITSGVVGAVGNNGIGVTGVAWAVQLMELKFIDSTGSGSTSAELPCIDYAIAHGVSVINASFGSQGASQAEMDAIQAAGKAGIIFVCAAGNSAENIDISPFFPADYPLDNIISVGASDNRDLPVYFSNYGSGSVEIFAPGENILSTYNTSTSAYAYESGTSLAAPFVTGAVALLRAQHPGDTYRETINRILNGADRIAGLAGKAQTGGRLDLANSLASAPNTAPNALFANRTVLVGLDPYTRSNNVDTPLALEAGTPAIPGGTGAGGHSLWWQWTAPEAASVEIDTSGTGGGQYITGGSTYATLLGVYTGSSLDTLATVAQNATFATEPLEGSPGTMVPYSEVTFEATAGTTYQINVQGQGGATGQAVLAINTDPDYDSFSKARGLTGPSVSVLDANSNATREAGEPAILGNAGGHSLWYYWQAPYTGTAQVSGYSYDFNPAVAVYTGTALNSLTTVAAASATANSGTTTVASQCLCTFSATQNTIYMITVDGVTANDIGEFTLSIADSQWQAATGDAVTCSPAVGTDGTVYVGSSDNAFYAFKPDGTVKWSFTAKGIFDTSSAAIGPDGTVYAGCTDGNVYAFMPNNGTVKWIYPVPTPSNPLLDNGLNSSPALAQDGTVYIHADDGNLYALDPTSGAMKWTFAVPGFSYAAPTIAPDGTVYIGTDGGQLYAINPAARMQKWIFTTLVSGDPIYTAAAIDAQGNVYFGTLSGNFYSVDPGGNKRWTYAVGNGITSAPALANGNVYFGAYDGNLYALTTAGLLAWKYPLGTQVRASAPAVDSNGVVYVGCYDHNVYAVTPGGALSRVYASDDVIRSSPVIAGTTLCFGSEDHKVYAFNIGAGPAASDWPMYQFGGQRPGRAVPSVLEITSQPAGQLVTAGSPFSLTVGAAAPGAITYQWYLNGGAITGAVSSTYTVASASAANAGSYTAVVTSGSSSVTSAPAVVTVSAAIPGKIVNLSARADVGAGANILIAGFVISGSGSKGMVLRGVGPTLNTLFGLTGVLAQPQLTLINPQTGSTIVTGAAWGGSTALANDFTQVGAFALPANSADAAVFETLPAGAYTSEIAGVNSTTGVALAEIYDADPGSTTASLLNLSARASVGTGGNILIGGFVIEGTQPAQVLLRGVGPTLANAPFNLTGVLEQPSVGLYDSTGAVISSNTGWGNAPVAGPSTVQATVRQATASDMSGVGAFALPIGSADSAMITTLPAGSYTLELSGVSGTTGVGLIEIYLMP